MENSPADLRAVLCNKNRRCSRSGGLERRIENESHHPVDIEVARGTVRVQSCASTALVHSEKK